MKPHFRVRSRATIAVDERLRILMIEGPRGRTTRYAYDDERQIAGMTYPDGRFTEFRGRYEEISCHGNETGMLAYLPVD